MSAVVPQKVELLAKAFDHAKHAYKFGFRMLTVRVVAIQKGIAVMLELLKQAKKVGIPAKYVLFDSWPSSPRSIHVIKETGYDVIAIVNKTLKMFFRYNGEALP